MKKSIKNRCHFGIHMISVPVPVPLPVPEKFQSAFAILTNIDTILEKISKGDFKFSGKGKGKGKGTGTLTGTQAQFFIYGLTVY